MKIYTVTCEQGCPPRHFTASHRAEAARTAHYIAKGHASKVHESRVEVSE